MRFRERVQVPPSWWVFAVLFAGTLAGAFGFYLGRGFALGIGLPALVFVGLGFWASSYVIEVDDTEIRVGRAVLGRSWVSAVRPLDAARTATRSGVEADARAHLVLRPWVSTTVELTLDDPADPVPYWLVSTRRPGALASALGWVAVPDPQTQDPQAPSVPDHEVQVALVLLEEDLPLPVYAHAGDAGADLHSAEDLVLEPGRRRLVRTGVALALPEGYAGFVHPRSGLAHRHGLTVVNAPGTIDAGYRGEVCVNLLNTDPLVPVTITRGDRIAQLVVQQVARAQFVVTDVLPTSSRGTGGHGSTGA